MVKRISTDVHTYGGRELKSGDEFDVEPRDVALLLSLNRIKRQDGDPQTGFDKPAIFAGTYGTRSMVAAGAARQSSHAGKSSGKARGAV